MIKLNLQSELLPHTPYWIKPIINSGGALRLDVYQRGGEAYVGMINLSARNFHCSEIEFVINKTYRQTIANLMVEGLVEEKVTFLKSKNKTRECFVILKAKGELKKGIEKAWSEDKARLHKVPF